MTCPNCGKTVQVGLPCCPYCFVSLVPSQWAGNTYGSGYGSIPQNPQTPPAWEFIIHSIPPGQEENVVLIITEMLKISQVKARWRIAQPERLIAVGLSPDIAWPLKMRLGQIGVVCIDRFVPVRPDPFPGEPADPRPKGPRVEPNRRIHLVSQSIAQPPRLTETYTAAGISLGHSNCYTSFAASTGNNLHGQPNLISYNGASVLPVAIYMDGGSARVGRDALKLLPKRPDLGCVSFTDRPDLPENWEAMNVFLAFVREQFNRILGIDPQERIPVVLGDRGIWSPQMADALCQQFDQVGMDLTAFVPDPLAVVSAFDFANHLLPPQPQDPLFYLVVDGGARDFRFSFVEYNEKGEVSVFEHIPFPLGGEQIDQILLDWLKGQLQDSISDQARQELPFSVPQFKMQMSRSFSQGNPEYSHPFILPGSTDPLFITISRAEFEGLIKAQLSELAALLKNITARVGLKNENIEAVLMAGGSSALYFVQPMLQNFLQFTPLKELRPEETVARGLTTFGRKA